MSTSAITIRPLSAEDEPVLREMMVHAIFVPPDTPAPDRSVLDLPEIARYFEGWGREDDLGFAAVDQQNAEVVGAVWLRRWPGADHGYGFVEAAVPELSIAVLPGYRGCGIGTRLLSHVLAIVEKHFPDISLSVTDINPAVSLYKRYGFEVVRRDGDSLLMLRKCPQP